MHLLGLILLSIAKVLRLLLNIYTVIVAAAVIVSWVNPDPYNPIVRFLYQATQPVFRQIRRLVPRALFRTGFDWTPIFVFILLIVIDTTLVGLLFEWAHQLLSK
jgi:YggT family protein